MAKSTPMKYRAQGDAVLERMKIQATPQQEVNDADSRKSKEERSSHKCSPVR